MKYLEILVNWKNWNFSIEISDFSGKQILKELKFQYFRKSIEISVFQEKKYLKKLKYQPEIIEISAFQPERLKYQSFNTEISAFQSLEKIQKFLEISIGCWVSNFSFYFLYILIIPLSTHVYEELSLQRSKSSLNIYWISYLLSIRKSKFWSTYFLWIKIFILNVGDIILVAVIDLQTT